MLIPFAISFLVVLCGSVRSEGFSYKDPNNEWGRASQTCGGVNQSPVDIPFDYTTAVLEDQQLQWHQYDNLPNSMQIVNNGHTVRVNPVWYRKSNTPYLTGGPLNGEYVMEQFHFHWGQNDDVGSEHTINGKSGAMELHMVHWKRDYGSLQEAVKHKDGVAVVASIYRVDEGKKASDGINRVWTRMGNLRRRQAKRQLRPFRLTDFPEVNGKDLYVSYYGSLTTPGCNEAVTWLVTANEYSISRQKMKQVRAIGLASGYDHNNRPVQKLGDRRLKIYPSSN